jgi:IS4 transposase
MAEQMTSKDRDRLIELGVVLKRIEQDVLQIRRDQSDNYVTRREISGLEREVAKLQDSQTWSYRLVLGSVGLAILGLVIGVQ